MALPLELRKLGSVRKLEVLAGLAEALKKCGRGRDAAEVCMEIARDGAGTLQEAHALDFAAECLASAGDFASAWSHWRRSVELTPVVREREVAEEDTPTELKRMGGRGSTLRT